MKKNSSLLALTDNWQIELALSLLDQESDTAQGVYSHYVYENSSLSGTMKAERKVESTIMPDQFSALFHFLDLFVLYDKVYYDEEFSPFWKKFTISKSLADYLLPVLENKNKPLSNKFDETFITYSKSNNNVPKERYSCITKNSHVKSHDFMLSGVQRYLNLSESIGATYWPAPPRASFIEKHLLNNIKSDFGVKLKRFIDKEATEMINESVNHLFPLNLHFLLPSLGSSILANCNTKQAILKTAIEMKESKECKLFRAWLLSVENSIASGDVASINNAKKEINEVILSVKKGLDLLDDEKIDFDLKVALLPSLTLSRDSIRKMLKQKSKIPCNLIFIKKHFERVLHSACLNYQVERLFNIKLSH